MFQEIRTSCEPAVIGVRNGLYQTELIDDKSFPSENIKDKFIDAFANPSNLNLFGNERIKVFPLKRAKQTDIVSCNSDIFDLDFLVSEKVIEIIESFESNDFIKIPIEIDGWNSKYFAVSFSKYPISIVNFNKSIFIYQDYDNKQGKFIDIQRNINSSDEYNDLMTEITPRKILLLKKVKDKAFHINGIGLFFSQSIIDIFLSERVTGFSLHNTYVLS